MRHPNASDRGYSGHTVLPAEPPGLPPRRALLGLFLAIGPAALVGFSILAAVRGVDLGYYTRDPAATLDADSLLGAVSHLGVVLWAVSAGICYFAVVYAPTDSDIPPRMLLVFAALSAVLWADDLFMFHDRYWWRVTRAPEAVLYLLYAAVLGTNLVVYREAILNRTRHRRLAAALVLLGGSAVIDPLPDDPFGAHHALFEDGLKLLGVCGWTVYLAETAARSLRGRA